MSKWLDYYGKEFTDKDIFEKVLAAEKDREFKYQIIIGTDSNANGRQYKFVSVLCLYKIGHGADYYYQASYEPRSTYRGNNHKMRLFQEAVKSVEMADFLRDEIGVIPCEVHADVSDENTQEFSSDIAKQIKGYITGCGYNAVIKPGSWAANCVADKHSK